MTEDRRAGRRMRPYSTFELSKLLGRSARTVARMIEAGEFGPKGTAWYWTKAGPGRGSRRVKASAVEKYMARRT